MSTESTGKSSVKPKEELTECPLARLSSHRRAGMMTTHKCMAKPALEFVCDGETKKGCALFRALQENSELRAQIEGWVEKAE